MKIAASEAISAMKATKLIGRRQLVLVHGWTGRVRRHGLDLSAPCGDGSRRGGGSHRGGRLSRLGLGFGRCLSFRLGGYGLRLRCRLFGGLGRGRRRGGRCSATSLGARRRGVAVPELVDGGEVCLVVREVGLVEDCVDGACGFARATVDAGHRVDVEHPVFAFFEVDAVDRADLDAGLILHVDAGLGDDERHALLSLRRGDALACFGAIVSAPLASVYGVAPTMSPAGALQSAPEFAAVRSSELPGS